MTQYDKFITTPHREHSLLMKYFYLLIFPFYFVINFRKLYFYLGLIGLSAPWRR